MGILPVLVLLAGKMPAPHEILGYFFNWKSLSVPSHRRDSLGQDRGKFVIPEDFNAPLPDDILAAFEGE